MTERTVTLTGETSAIRIDAETVGARASRAARTPGDIREAVVLFSGGAGAWELGLEWAGVKTVLSCELDPIRRAFLALNFPGVPHHDDIRTLTAELVRRRVGKGDDWRPWLVCGSPPCQDASVANQAGKGLDGERTGLFRQGVRVVRELRSDWVAFENVAGLTVREAWTILGWLGDDYEGWVHRMGDEDVGAPQRAWRRWIIARRTSPSSQDPQRRRGQSRHSKPDSAAEADKVPIRTEDRQGIHADGGHAAGTPVGERDRPLARRQSARRNGRGAWRERAIEIARRHLRMANGLPGRLALKVQESYGDSFPPVLAQIWAESMMDAEQ